MEILPKNQVYIRVRNIIALRYIYSEQTKEKIREASMIKEDLGLDSLDIIELSFNLEEEFNIECQDEDVDKFITVGDVVNFVFEKVNPKNGGEK